jgi:GrpB-like predicted nucleotidyltransferase (UPF0157 family)
VISGERTIERHPSLDDRIDPAVRMLAHDPAWNAVALREQERIARALGAVAVRVEHVGSTAVPGLAAKPIVDIQMSVLDVGRRERFVGGLEQIGYLFVSDPESLDYHFFAKPPGRPRSHHLHVCQLGSEHESRHLAVRDYLRTHHREAASYEALKRELVERHPEDRLAYIKGKKPYVDDLEERALAWARTIGASPAGRSGAG